MGSGSSILAIIKRHFVSGVLVVVPIILTYIVLKFLFEAIDGVMQPILYRLVGYHIPGLGIITSILLITLAGFFTRNIIGARLYRTGDRVLARLPIIRPIYSAAKQLLEAIATPSVSSFKEVVLIQYPRKGTYALTFLSKRVRMEVDGRMRDLVTVFVPSTPTPISGMVIMLPAEEVIFVDMTVEEGTKFLVSGGVASPELIAHRHPPAVGTNHEVNNETR